MSALAALITEIIGRAWVMRRETHPIGNPHELRAERYLELSQGLGLLCLSLGGLHLQSDVLLRGVDLLILARTTGSIFGINIPGRLLLPIPQARSARLLMTIIALNFIGEFALAIGKISFIYQLAISVVALILYSNQGTIFARFLNNGYFELGSYVLVAWKMERIASFFLSIKAMMVAAFAVNSYFFFKEAAFKVPVLQRGVATALFGLNGALFLAAALLWLDSSWFFVNHHQAAALDLYIAQMLPPECKPARDLLYKAAYQNYVETTERIKFIKAALHLLVLNPHIFPKFFYYYASLFTTEAFAQFIKMYPQHLTAKYLLEHRGAWGNLWQGLWEKMSDDEIKTYLFLPGIAQMLNEEWSKGIDQEIEVVDQKFAHLTSKVTFIHPPYRFETIRPWLEELNKIDEKMQKEDNFFSLIPKIERPIVASLHALKLDIQTKRGKIADLEEKLRKYCDWAQPAMECLGELGLRSSDFDDVLKAFGIEIAADATKVIYHLLSERNIKWKGDLINRQIIDDPNDKMWPDLNLENTTKALKERLIDRLKG